MSPARMCSVPSSVLAHELHRAGRVAALEQLDQAACWSLERVSTSSGWAISAIRSLICPWTSVIAATSRGELRRLGEPMWKRMSVRRYSSKSRHLGHLLHQLVEPVEVARPRPLGGQQRGARSRSRRGSRARRACPLVERLGAPARRQRRRLGHEGPAGHARAARRGARSGPASSAPGAGSSGRSAAAAASSRSGGRRVPGASRPSRIAVPSRSTVSSNVVGGGTGSNTASTASLLSIGQRYPLRAIASKIRRDGRAYRPPALRSRSAATRARRRSRRAGAGVPTRSRRRARPWPGRGR